MCLKVKFSPGDHAPRPPRRMLPPCLSGLAWWLVLADHQWMVIFVQHLRMWHCGLHLCRGSHTKMHIFEYSPSVCHDTWLFLLVIFTLQSWYQKCASLLAVGGSFEASPSKSFLQLTDIVLRSSLDQSLSVLFSSSLVTGLSFSLLFMQSFPAVSGIHSFKALCTHAVNWSANFSYYISFGSTWCQIKLKCTH